MLFAKLGMVVMPVIPALMKERKGKSKVQGQPELFTLSPRKKKKGTS
jgi:hypothetical protein